MTSRARTDRDLGRMGQQALRHGVVAMALLFLVIGIYTAVAPYGPHFPEGTRVPLVISHLVIVAIACAMYQVCRRLTLSPMKVNAISATLSFALTGNLALGALLGANPLFSFCIAVLIIGSCGTLMSTTWAIAIALGELVGWALVARVLFSDTELQQSLFVMAASIAVAFIVHLSRKFAVARILELRKGDVLREVALQQALAEADEARRGLDRKVLERTAALRDELEERQRLEEQLRHAQKMEAVGRLAGGIAHDFNNLLTAIIGYTDIVLTSLDPKAERRADAEEIARAAMRAADLTQQMLAFSRRQVLQLKVVDLNISLSKVEPMLRRFIGEDIALTVSGKATSAFVRVDPGQVEQV
ncbi:MAG: histidine kinase dimerization/phospho-acceptor domain-containing protein, partial [Solirubrobacteraceae bacterium]